MQQLKKDKLYSRYRIMFNSMYAISICKKEEIEDVIEFINQYWKRGHALVESKDLMDWQYYNKVDDTYNFVLARSRTSGKIHAIEGFIPTTQFDHNIKTPMTWGAIWKTRSDVAPPGLGMAVKLYRENEYSTPYFSEIGISEDAEKYNRFFDNTIFYLCPWYMCNTNLNDYKLIKPSQLKSTITVDRYKNVELKEITLREWKECNEIKNSIPPFKSVKYYENRYFKHPIYNYKSILLSDGKEIEVIFYRVVKAFNSNCIFFVDYIGHGHVLKKSHRCFEDLLKKTSAEYILFLCHGINEEYLLEAGFTLRNNNDIVPIYYEPFLKQNVDILCASRSSRITWPSFKGDSDQDRPNLILKNL